MTAAPPKISAARRFVLEMCRTRSFTEKAKDFREYYKVEISPLRSAQHDVIWELPTPLIPLQWRGIYLPSPANARAGKNSCFEITARSRVSLRQRTQFAVCLRLFVR